MTANTPTTIYPLAEDVWPTGGVPLVKEAVSPYFLPVTTQILDEIVRRIVAALDPERIIRELLHGLVPIQIVFS